jgi:hypothetical protein
MRANIGGTVRIAHGPPSNFSAQQNRIAGDADLIKDYVALQNRLSLGWLHD